jgi:hypothetical protein
MKDNRGAWGNHCRTCGTLAPKGQEFCKVCVQGPEARIAHARARAIRAQGLAAQRWWNKPNA